MYLGLKRDKVVERWRKLRKQEPPISFPHHMLSCVHIKQNCIIGGMWRVWGGETRGIYMVLVRKPEGNIPLGRLKRKQKDNIKSDLEKQVIWEVVYWINLAKDTDKLRAAVKTVMKFLAP